VPSTFGRVDAACESCSRSATPWRRLSREVSRLVRLMKWLPELSMLPSGPGAPV
jgi:hypothetical protein